MERKWSEAAIQVELGMATDVGDSTLISEAADDSTLISGADISRLDTRSEIGIYELEFWDYYF